MAAKKGGLGKGLEALFAENATEEEGKTVSLRIHDIEPNRNQPRKQFNDAALTELAESISQHGVLQPLLVRPLPGGGYQLVAGERRWRASRMAGLDEVPVIIREMGDREAAELAMIENLQREDLNPMEEALGYRSLMQDYHMTQEEAARVVNKSRSAVANALRLLNLPAPVADMVGDGRLSAGHARAILSIPGEEDQTAIARKVAANGLSVREVEKLAKALQEEGQRQAGDGVSRETDNAFSRKSLFSEVELSLKEHMGRRVKVAKGKKEGGTLQIEFFDEEDLKSLANRLAPDND